MENKRHSINPFRLPNNTPKAWSKSLLICLAALILSRLGDILITLACQFFEFYPAGSESIRTEVLNPDPLVASIAILYIILLAPILEELLFRGLLFRILQNHMRWGYAFLFSGIYFASLHDEFLPVLWYAFLFTWVFKYTGRLECAMILHALTNLLSCIFILAKE